MKTGQSVFVVDPSTTAEGFSTTLTAVGGSFPRFTRRGRKNFLRRRQLIVSNRSDSNALRLVFNMASDAPSGADDDYAVLVFPRTNVSVFTDADVQVVNSTGTAIDVSVCEIFYSEP